MTLIDPDFNISFLNYSVEIAYTIDCFDQILISWNLIRISSVSSWQELATQNKNSRYTFSSWQLSVLPKMLQMLKKENKIKWNRFCICFYSLRHCHMMIIWVVKPTIVVKICICLHLLKSFLFLLFLKSTL